MVIVGALLKISRIAGFQCHNERSVSAPNDPVSITAQRDFDTIRSFITSSVSLAIFKLPWTVLFETLAFVFPLLLRWLVVAGGAVLVAMKGVNPLETQSLQRKAGVHSIRSDRISQEPKAVAQTILAIAMFQSAFDHRQTVHCTARSKSFAAGLPSAFISLTRTFRLFLQSTVLGVGAWLAVTGELTGGAIMTASIFLSRALYYSRLRLGDEKST